MKLNPATLNLEKLRTHFDAGDLTSAAICPAVMEPGPTPCWIAQFKRRNGATIVLELDKRRNGRPMQRVFKSLDAAYSACRNIGFREVKIRE